MCSKHFHSPYILSELLCGQGFRIVCAKNQQIGFQECDQGRLETYPLKRPRYRAEQQQCNYQQIGFSQSVCIHKQSSWPEKYELICSQTLSEDACIEKSSNERFLPQKATSIKHNYDQCKKGSESTYIGYQSCVLLKRIFRFV